MVVAYEHHMKRDLTGLSAPDSAPRQLSVFSKIVAIADGFDAATSRRAYQTVPFTPAQVMLEMRDNPRRGMDPVIVKAFINLTGIYPVGTLVVLDTFELGIVHAVNPTPGHALATDRPRHQRRTGQPPAPRARSSTSPIGTPRAASCARSSRRRIPIAMASASATTSSERCGVTNASSGGSRELRAAGRRALVPLHHRRTSRRRARPSSCIAALEEAGADIIELGVPFSDPMADGPIIQASSQRALEQGMTFDRLLALVDRAPSQRCRSCCSAI